MRSLNCQLSAVSPSFPVLAQQRRAERQQHTEHDKGHGRRETPTIETTTALNHVLAGLDWSSVQQVFRITRKRTVPDSETGVRKTTTEVVFASQISPELRPMSSDCSQTTDAIGASKTKRITCATSPSARTRTRRNRVSAHK